MKKKIDTLQIRNKEELEACKKQLSYQEYLKTKARIEEIERQIQNMIFEGSPAIKQNE